MKHVLVEELINLRQYQFALSFDLPLQVSMAVHLELQAKVTEVRQLLRPEGLHLHGTVLEELRLTDGESHERREQLFHFTYLIPRADLKEANLLNFEIEATIEQVLYHFIKKDGQVILKQQLQMKINLLEYQVTDRSRFVIGGLQKKSGFLQRKIGEEERSLLRLYPVQLPADFAQLHRLTGQLDQEKVEVTQDGCILEFVCRMQCEYVTTGQKLGTFFFEKNEYVFFPLVHGFTGGSEAEAYVTLNDLSLDSELAGEVASAEITALYLMRVQFYQKNEVCYYTPETSDIPEGSSVKMIEVEQLGQTLVHSNLLEERVSLAELDLKQVVNVDVSFLEKQVDEAEQLLLSGMLEFIIYYIDDAGLERSFRWVRRVDEMITYTALPVKGEGRWRLNASVKIASWDGSKVSGAGDKDKISPPGLGNVGESREKANLGGASQTSENRENAGLRDLRRARANQVHESPPGENRAVGERELVLTVVLDYQLAYYLTTVEPVLTELPDVLEEVQRERFCLVEEIARGEVTFQGEEKAYLLRYATKIRQITGRVQSWQVRTLEGGWMVRGEGDIDIYFLDREGERHFSQPFRFYQYIPASNVSPDTEVRLAPRVLILDHEMLEDGSALRVQYLVRLEYALFRRLEEELITGIGAASHLRVRPVLRAGLVEQKLSQRVALEERVWALNMVKAVHDLKLDWRNYRVWLETGSIKLVGEMVLEVRYETTFGKERVKIIPLPIEILEQITIQGEPYQLRAVPQIKGYDYRLTGHPAKDGQIELSIALEVHYRLIGTDNSFCAETFPVESTT